MSEPASPPPLGRPASRVARTSSRYASRTGRDLGHLGFHEALACFKLAVILEGIHYRHVHGQTLGDGFAGIGAMVEPLVAMGLESLRQDETGRRD